MKRFIEFLIKFCVIMFAVPKFALADYNVSEIWSTDLRSQIKVECSTTTNLCVQLCNNAASCVLKNSTCKDCISTGVKMTYFFAAFGKDIVAKNLKVDSYEFIDFLTKETFIAFSANSIYNQFDAAQSDALAARFKALCPNKYQSPLAFFQIENRELNIKNA
ncbi:MAG: hypothetical protein K2Q18_07440, partial [Bdellovibrionales bacterium]|nr:hypothetical protein [Bdellovibrionales bacterium]